MDLKNIGSKFKFISALCYDSLCDVYEYQYLENPKTSSLEGELTKVYEGVPCRVSYERFQNAQPNEDVQSLNVGIRLFFNGDDAKIKEGSVIHVFKNGSEMIFKSAGGTAIYGSHCEIKLIASKDKA